MKRLTASWTFACAAERFWRVFLDAACSRALYHVELRPSARACDSHGAGAVTASV